MFMRADLAASGFTGFVPLISLETSRVATAGGVYVVLRESNGAPLFLERSSGGHFKSKDPTAAQSVLEARWVEGCPVVYIGKATSLRSRLRQFRDFGQGKPIGHWGGRYLWQLADAAGLVVCWKPTVGDPRSVENEMLTAFRTRYGRLPYANINS